MFNHNFIPCRYVQETKLMKNFIFIFTQIHDQLGNWETEFRELLKYNVFD